jgi:FtsZ-interacting cell division protein ZipA
VISLLVIVVLVVAVAIVVAVIVSSLRRSRRSDGVATFRRQIDALSPEARRPVVDQVQQLEEDAEPPPDEDER